jgi:hypothetical protein
VLLAAQPAAHCRPAERRWRGTHRRTESTPCYPRGRPASVLFTGEL